MISFENEGLGLSNIPGPSLRFFFVLAGDGESGRMTSPGRTKIFIIIYEKRIGLRARNESDCGGHEGTK